MNRKFLATFCVAVAVSGMLALNMYPPIKGQATTKTQPTGGGTPPPVSATPRLSNVPDYVIYRQVFHHLMALKDHAAAIEHQGGDGRALRSYYQDKAGLKGDQATALDQIAADCERDVAKLDAQAQKIIDASRARYKDGKVPAGQKLPPPPPELHKLQEERITAIMTARDRLRTALGAQGFQQFDDFVKLDVAPRINPAQSQQPGGGH